MSGEPSDTPSTPIVVDASADDRVGVITSVPTDRRHRPLESVIVPTDFSAASIAALGFAESIVVGTERCIRLLHAVPPSPLEEISGAQQSLVDAAYARLEGLAAPIRRRGASIECVATVGAPADLVEQAAAAVERQGGRALVAIGDRGQSALRRAVLGSVADAVLRRLEGPVLVVHENDEPSDRMQVIVAYGFDRESDEALDAFVELFSRRAEAIDVEVVHALPELDWVEGTDAPLLRSAFADEIEQRRGAELASIADRLRVAGFVVDTFVVRGDPARAVLARATARRADLVVSGRRHRRVIERMLLGSTTEGIVHRARCAVLSAGLSRAAVGRTSKVMIMT